MTRTTLKLDPGVLRRLKRQAADEGTSLQDVANRLLKRALATSDRPEYRLVLTGWDAAVQPGVDILDRDQLFDVLNTPER